MDQQGIHSDSTLGDDKFQRVVSEGNRDSLNSDDFEKVDVDQLNVASFPSAVTDPIKSAMDGAGSGVQDLIQTGKQNLEQMTGEATNIKDNVSDTLHSFSTEAEKRFDSASVEAQQAIIGVTGTIEDEAVGLTNEVSDSLKKFEEPVKDEVAKLSNTFGSDVLGSFATDDRKSGFEDSNKKVEEPVVAKELQSNVESSSAFQPGLIDEPTSENLLGSFSSPSVPSKANDDLSSFESIPTKAANLLDESISSFDAAVSKVAAPSAASALGDLKEKDDLLVDSSPVLAPKDFEEEAALNNESFPPSYEDFMHPTSVAPAKEPSPSPPRQPSPLPREPTPPREPSPPPKAPTPAPREPTPPPKEPTPPPREPTPPPREPTPPPKEPTPPPKEPTPPPKEPTPPPRAPTPKEPTPPPKETTPPKFTQPAVAPVKVGKDSVTKSSSAKYTSSANPLTTFNPRALFHPEQLDPRVAELIYWRDPKKSGAVLGSALVLLFSLAFFSVISVFSYTALMVLFAAISFRIYKNIKQAVQKTQDGHPFKEFLAVDVSLPADNVHSAVDVLLSQLNSTLSYLQKIFLVEDLIDTCKFGCYLWVLTYIGAWLNGLTVIILLVIGLFSIPKAYEQNKTQVDQLLGQAQQQVNQVLEKIKAVIPIGGGNKEKEQ